MVRFPSTSKTILDGEAGHVTSWPNSATNLPLHKLSPHEIWGQADVRMVDSASQSLRLCTVGLWLPSEGHGQFVKAGVPTESECFLEIASCTGKCCALVPGNYKSLFKKCWNGWSAMSCKITGVKLSLVCYMNTGPNSLTA